MGRTPRERAERMERRRTLPPGDGERLAGYGVMALPFASGDLLAFRRFTASSIGPPYVSVWHRDPGGRWRFHVNVEPRRSCPRYFGAAIDEVLACDIRIGWTGGHELTVSVPAARLDWSMRLSATPMIRALNGAAGLMTERMWRDPNVLAGMGAVAGRALALGRVALTGRLPNGQTFRINPLLLLSVDAAAATVGGRELGPIAPLPHQVRLGDFWLPNRGVFAFGRARFEPLDPARHRTTCARSPVSRP